MHEDISADILTYSINKHSDIVTDTINESFRDGEFPYILKYAEVIPAHYKKDHFF